MTSGEDTFIGACEEMEEGYYEPKFLSHAHNGHSNEMHIVHITLHVDIYDAQLDSLHAKHLISRVVHNVQGSRDDLTFFAAFIWRGMIDIFMCMLCGVATRSAGRLQSADACPQH